MKPKITLKDIARELEVSISTVSKALKNSEEISRDTKDKIQAFAKLYNYKPNNIAVSLKNRRTKNIGVIIPDIVHHFFTTVILGIEKYANAKGYNVLVCVSNEGYEREVINMELLANGSIDGFIMSLSTETQQKSDYNHIKEVTDQGIPMVMFDRVTERIQCDKVVIDDAQGAFLAVKKFVESGKKKIALITTDDYLSVGKARTDGYKKALAHYNIPLEESLILKMPSMEVEATAFDTFFKTQKVDAVLCVNEIFAMHAMRLVHGMNKRIPETSIEAILYREQHLLAMCFETVPLLAKRPEEEIGQLEDQATSGSATTGYRASSRNSLLGLLLLEKQLLICAL